ncbi:MAG: malate dehydrogenase, partial [Planctomycetota bacterium]
DVVEGLAAGKALDLLAAAPLRGNSFEVRGATDLSAVEGADVIVTTAGLARRPGMDRMDLLVKNAGISSGIAEGIARHAMGAVVVNVTNPLDVITENYLRKTDFPRERIIGMAGVLDSARFAAFLADALKVSAKDVNAMVLGGHGDSMVPLVSSATVGGVPVEKLLPPEKIAPIVERTRKAGAEVVALLKTGSAFVSPAAAAVRMVRAILLDERRLMPASVHLEGEYGHEGVCLGVPVVLGRYGVREIIEVELSADEKTALDRSAAAVREGIAALS